MPPLALVHARDTAASRGIKAAAEGILAQKSSPDTPFRVLDHAVHARPIPIKPLPAFRRLGSRPW
jgi:hypothetical protein